MKSKLNAKLSLKKSTIAALDSQKLSNAKGGYYYTEMYGGAACYTWHPVCVTKPDYVCNEPTIPIKTVVD